jgi:hypothetical protein
VRWLIFLKHAAASRHEQMKWQARMRDARAVRLTHDGKRGFECIVSVRWASGLQGAGRAGL